MIQDDDELRVATTVRRSIVRFWRRLQLERPERTVSATQMSLLGHLIRYGQLSVGELAALDRAVAQSLTRPLAALEASGYISRRPDPADARRVLVAITRAGREAAAADMRPRDEWLAARLSDLTPAERGLLELAAELLDRLSQDMEVIARHTRDRADRPETERSST